MRTTTRLIGLGLAAALLAACGKQDAPAEAAPAKDKAASALASNAPVQEAPLRGTPDFGGTTQVAREADGIGSTPELAVLAALQSAVAQVNGVRVASQMQSLRAGLHVDVDGEHVGDIRADAFSQQMIAGSQGAVLGYEILSQDEVSQLDEETIARVRASDEGWSFKGSASASASGEASAKGGSASASVKENYEEQVKVDAKRGASSFDSDVTRRSMRSYWKVRVRAQIAQYRAPDEEGKPKIVVALPRTKSGSYAVGDGRVNADEVAQAIRARLSDTLTQTQRFIVLDREFGDELQAEIDHINSGNVRLQDTARVGQQLATDLILIPTIERFEYPRSVRNLRMSDRQVTSYSGGGRITLRLVNATTGQVVMSDS
ncbi:CsgG/HfaB family protein, partial [Stenotrophomonas lactitubi]